MQKNEMAILWWRQSVYLLFLITHTHTQNLRHSEWAIVKDLIVMSSESQHWRKWHWKFKEVIPRNSLVKKHKLQIKKAEEILCRILQKNFISKYILIRLLKMVNKSNLESSDINSIVHKLKKIILDLIIIYKVHSTKDPVKS